MAYFHSIRGWVEIEPDHFAAILAALESLQARYKDDPKLSLYTKGWSWSETTINWTRYLFYGADVTDEGLEFFDRMLTELTEKFPGTSGYFHAQGEDGERNVSFVVVDDHVIRQPTNPIVKVT